MFKKILFITTAITLLASNQLFSQDWLSKMQDPSVNFYDVQKSFNKYWKKEERKEKLEKIFSLRKNKPEEENEGYLLYKRWENFVEPRVYPSGDRSLLNKGNEQFQKLVNNHNLKGVMQAGGDWKPLGAFSVPTGGGGAGRLNCIQFHPTNANTIFVGAPVGGLWKTTNGGTSWSTNTDNLPSLGVSDIAIDATNTNIMYIATGDLDAGDSYSVGVLKSIDGGITWNSTGLSFSVNQTRRVARILINPNDHNMLFVAASNGVYKSIDAGDTFTKVLAINNAKDMELNPNDPSIIYVVSSSGFYKSTNTGNSFSIVNSGLPTSSVNRIAIAVTPADANYVYLLYSDGTSSNLYGFKGLYRSTDSGTTFTKQSSSPNVLGFNADGSDKGGQGWYTLSIAASPINKNEIIVGGVNIWKSTNGGANWSLNSFQWGGGNTYVHPDIHGLVYNPAGTAYYAATDGGIFKTSSSTTSWSDKSNGLQIGQMYRLGNSATNSKLVIQGWQDNGCSLYNNGAWEHVLSADGMEAFIDWSDSKYMYGESQYGGLSASTNGGASFNSISGDIDASGETGSWVTPWLQDPVTPTTIYAGFSNVWKSTNRGQDWTKISTFNSGGLTCLAVAPSNPQYIYASNGSGMYKTTNGGTSWTTIGAPMAGSNTITYIAICTTDPTKIWITRSGYSANNKVFKSNDAGATWTNMALNLPNVPANCVVNQTGTNDGIYVGTDIGVYYIDNDLTSWMPFSNGFPNVTVDELEIQYSSSKLRAATYGRGLWETTIVDPSSNLPFANFDADKKSGCTGLTVQFSDSTKNNPTAWSWTFPGGTPSISNLQNPLITYNTPGVYNNVTLVVTNANGVDSVTKYSYIAISPNVQPTITLSGNDSICSGQSLILNSSTANSFLWHPANQNSSSISVNATGTYSVTTTDIFGCSTTSQPIDIYVFTTPPTPTITLVADTLISSATTGNQWYMNGVIIIGETNQKYIVTVAGATYTVKVTDTSGVCSSTSTNFVGVEYIANIGIGYSIYPNPTNSIANITLQALVKDDVLIELTDIVGKKITERKLNSFVGRTEIQIDISTFDKGVYLISIKNSKGASTTKLVVY